MIDLDKLARQAFSDKPGDVVVERAWLAQVHTELMAGRQATAELLQIFARRERHAPRQL